MKMKKVCIIGAGSWGTALSTVLSQNCEQVLMWGRAEDGIEEMQMIRENRRFLPGVMLADNIQPTTDMQMAMKDAELVVGVVPSHVMRSALEQAKPYITPEMLFLNCAKGLEVSTGKRMSEVFLDVLGDDIRDRLAVLSGPSHAEEVGRKIPTAVAIASYRPETAARIQEIFITPEFRPYTNPDIVGVELGGTLKNIVALAAGMMAGMGYGDNAQAALITRGLTEMMRMGKTLGGDPRTFSGLSGLGDLVVTCSSEFSRNRRAGRLLAQNKKLEEVLQEVGMVVEGVNATRIIYKLAREYGVEMPLCEACHRVLEGESSVQEEVLRLMMREHKDEMQDLW